MQSNDLIKVKIFTSLGDNWYRLDAKRLDPNNKPVGGLFGPSEKTNCGGSCWVEFNLLWFYEAIKQNETN